MIGGLLRSLADRIDPPKPDPRARMPVEVDSHQCVFSDEHMDNQRRDDALGLMDVECRGYVLLQLRDEHGYLRIAPSFAVPEEAWPAMKETLARCALEAGRIYG